ncbi:hypothetical protein QAO71_01000 [Halopseudomonas sp. SMJS2]|uniref:hypothetical protein n=1 Tax=Halopseudomonas sp. SMJS2 TaxID=3041098 RepID=UPI002452B1B3|nr:hypothetical protein [Halopseudomonas sp. SMJS2]WGK61867.1 hypothetical protein QAO71_01000 [Halopseudomonas sp. SMJS2]
MKGIVSKANISREQINKACDLHLAGEYICSLTLAGSSDSLTHELNQGRGQDSGDSWHIKFIRFWREKSGLPSPSKREINYQKNWARNLVKHHNAGEAEEIEINLEFESFLAIKRSIENYQRLGHPRTEIMERFNEQTRECG